MGMTRKNRSQRTLNRQRGILRRVTLVLGAVIAVGLATSLVFDDMGLLKYWTMRTQSKDLERELGDLEQTNAALRTEIRRLQQDQRRIEELARERLGYVRPNETVYQVVPAPAPAE